MNFIDVRDLKGKIKPDARFVSLKVGELKQKVLLAYQKTGYGQKRFFICPDCDKRVEYLYITDKGILKCRHCSGVRYEGIQNTTQGGYDEIAYRMKRYANKHNIEFDFPFSYLAFANDQRCNKQKFRQYLMVLQALENMRFQALFYKKHFTSGLLRQVISGKHPLLQLLTLSDMREWLYDWYTGEQIMQAVPTGDSLKL